MEALEFVLSIVMSVVQLVVLFFGGFANGSVMWIAGVETLESTGYFERIQNMEESSGTTYDVGSRTDYIGLWRMETGGQGGGGSNTYPLPIRGKT